MPEPTIELELTGAGAGGCAGGLGTAVAARVRGTTPVLTRILLQHLAHPSQGGDQNKTCPGSPPSEGWSRVAGPGWVLGGQRSGQLRFSGALELRLRRGESAVRKPGPQKMALANPSALESAIATLSHGKHRSAGAPGIG
jgi:hypothetical protein